MQLHDHTSLQQEQQETAAQETAATVVGGRGPATPSSLPRIVRRRQVYAGAVAVLFISLAAVLVFTIFGPAVTQRPGSHLAGGNAHHTPSPALSPTSSGTMAAELPGQGWALVGTLPAPSHTYYGPSTQPPVPDVAWSPAAPRTLYLCRAQLTAGFGTPSLAPLLFRSDDLGASWHALALPEPATACDINLDATDAHTVLLTDDQGGTFLSRDSGSSWAPVPAPPGVPAPSATSPLYSVLVAGGRVYVEDYWTTNLRHWTRWYAGSGVPSPIAIDPWHPDTLYALLHACPGAPSAPAAAAYGIYGICRSDDDGQNWRFLLSVTHTPGPNPGLCVAPDNSNVLYAWGDITLANATSTQRGLARSLDGGATWSPVMPSTDGLPATPADAACTGNTGLGLAMADDGTLYNQTTATETPPGQPPIPAGVAEFQGGAWHKVAPYPVVNRVLPTYGDPVLWLPQRAGPPLLLAFSRTNVYIYHLPPS